MPAARHPPGQRRSGMPAGRRHQSRCRDNEGKRSGSIGCSVPSPSAAAEAGRHAPAWGCLRPKDWAATPAGQPGRAELSTPQDQNCRARGSWPPAAQPRHPPEHAACQPQHPHKQAACQPRHPPQQARQDGGHLVGIIQGHEALADGGVVGLRHALVQPHQEAQHLQKR